MNFKKEAKLMLYLSLAPIFIGIVAALIVPRPVRGDDLK